MVEGKVYILIYNLHSLPYPISLVRVMTYAINNEDLVLIKYNSQIKVQIRTYLILSHCFRMLTTDKPKLTSNTYPNL